jgi:hypothetical protein
MEEIVIKTRPEVNRVEAEAEARKKIPADGVLLAWYDRTAGAGSPRPSGRASEDYYDNYARSRGAKAKVVVNDSFSFYFAPLPSNSRER